MDITIDVGDYKLNVRTAGVIIHNGKVLAHKNMNSNHYALIGGRVEVGENSADTVKREIKEELGKDYLQYEWLELSKIDQYLLLPEAIKDVLKQDKFPIHKINNDLK